MVPIPPSRNSPSAAIRPTPPLRGARYSQCPPPTPRGGALSSGEGLPTTVPFPHVRSAVCKVSSLPPPFAFEGTVRWKIFQCFLGVFSPLSFFKIPPYPVPPFSAPACIASPDEFAFPPFYFFLFVFISKRVFENVCFGGRMRPCAGFLRHFPPCSFSFFRFRTFPF